MTVLSIFSRFFGLRQLQKSWDSSVIIVTKLRAGQPRLRFSIPGRGRHFCLLLSSTVGFVSHLNCIHRESWVLVVKGKRPVLVPRYARTITPEYFFLVQRLSNQAHVQLYSLGSVPNSSSSPHRRNLPTLDAQPSTVNCNCWFSTSSCNLRLSQETAGSLLT